MWAEFSRAGMARGACGKNLEPEGAASTLQAMGVVAWPQGLGNSEISVEQAWAGGAARAFHAKGTAPSVRRNKDVLGTVRSK